MREFLILTFLVIFVSGKYLPTFDDKRLQYWFVSSDEKDSNQNSGPTCETEKCKDAAFFISKGLNESADPCTNFYEYACGGWRVNFPIPPKENEWNIDEIIQKDITNMKRSILEEEIKPEDTLPLQLEKKFYKSCMNLEAVQKAGLDPLIKIINGTGGWPLIMESDEWDLKKHTWQSIDAYYTNLTAKPVLFAIDLDSDLQNSSNTMMFLDQPEENLFSNICVPTNNVNSLISNYSDFMVYVSKALIEAQNKNISNEDFAKDISDLMAFGLHVMFIATSEEERQDYERWLNYNTIAEFQKFYNRGRPRKLASKINWLETFQTFFSDTGVTITESDVITIRELDYFHKLINLLNKTPVRTIVNYVHWMNIMKFLPFTTKEFSDRSIKMSNLISDDKDLPERWELCIGLDPIELGTSYKFVKRNITEIIIKEVTNVSENVRKQLTSDINGSSWLDEDVKMRNIEKVNNMELRIAYPKWYDNLNEFNKHFEGLELGDELFENLIKIMIYLKKDSYKLLKKPFDKKMWSFEPTVSNAYYLHSSNSLTILAAQIASPLFDSSLPKAVNYGSIGFVSGHEMSHGFDSSGRKFTKEGNLLPWWPKNEADTYEHKVNCIIEQFNNYSANGNLTIRENTADNLGMLAAFGAFKKLAAKRQDSKLPGLENVTSDQLFFLSFASTFCTTTKEVVEENNDVHALPPKRINGVVANMEGFDDAFKCSKKGSKCSIWK